MEKTPYIIAGSNLLSRKNFVILYLVMAVVFLLIFFSRGFLILHKQSHTIDSHSQIYLIT